MVIPPDPPLSRRERKKRDTRRRILDAAMALTATRPFEKVRIDEICTAADVANATFFLHFENKSALVRAFGEDIAARIAQELETAQRSATEQLQTLLSVYLREWTAHPSLMRQMLLEFISQPNDASDMNDMSLGLLALTVNVVRHGQETGEFSRATPPETAALALVAAWNSMAVSRAHATPSDAFANALWQTLEVFVTGLKRQEPLQRQ